MLMLCASNAMFMLCKPLTLVGTLYNRLLWKLMTMDGSSQQCTAESYTQVQELVAECRQAETDLQAWQFEQHNGVA